MYFFFNLRYFVFYSLFDLLHYFVMALIFSLIETELLLLFPYFRIQWSKDFSENIYRRKETWRISNIYLPSIFLSITISIWICIGSLLYKLIWFHSSIHYFTEGERKYITISLFPFQDYTFFQLFHASIKENKINITYNNLSKSGKPCRILVVYQSM